MQVVIEVLPGGGKSIWFALLVAGLASLVSPALGSFFGGLGGPGLGRFPGGNFPHDFWVCLCGL